MAKIKKRGRKALPQARRKRLAPGKTSAPRKSGDATLKQQLADSRAQQAATAAILKVIARSPSDVQPVFDAITSSAMRLLGGRSSAVTQVVGDMVHLSAHTATDQAGSEALKGFYPRPLSSTSGLAAVVRSGKPAYRSDTESDPNASREAKEVARTRGYRSLLWVPMLRDGVAFGTINVSRSEPGPFTDHQISLLKTFADQAVIAIENVRLFNETKEALERQKVSAEVLNVISNSVADTAPVFEAIVQSCQRLFASGNSIISLVGEDGLVRHEAIAIAAEHHGMSVDEARRFLDRGYPRPLAQSYQAYPIRKREVVHYPDMINGPKVPESMRQMGRDVGNFSMLIAPMLWEGKGIGTIHVARFPPSPFVEKEFDLLRTFADQAVIAIQNARLFNETREALERQTATAEILKVISGSPTNTQPVFESIVESAARLFPPCNASLVMRDGDQIQLSAATGPAVTNIEATKKLFPIPFDVDKFRAARAIAERRIIEVLDTEGPETSARGLEMSRTASYRSMAIVPLVREGVGIGAIVLMVPQPGFHLTPSQLNLVQTFADQAVIAIENVRLFNETREALERQTATAEILKVIASSPSDVQPVFDAIVHSAERLFGRRAALRIAEPAGLRLRARSEGIRAGTVKEVMPIDDESLVGQVALFGRAIQFSDLRGPDAPPFAREHAHTWNFRANAGAPLIRDGKTMGVITVTSPEIGAMTEKQMELLTTFADQAVIAIENVRLFKELQSRTEALTKSVGQLTALGEVGQAISSSLDLETVLQTIVSRAVQLTGVDAGSIYEYDEREEVYRLQAAERMAPELEEAVRRAPIRKGDGATGRTAETLEPVQVPDIQDESYHGSRKDNLMRTGYRAVLAVPLLRENHLLGALQVFRKAPGAFPPEVVELLKTFATQSAMAIQNARLFREIAEKGRQLEEASRHKSNFLASMSHELRTPLNAILGFNEMILGQVYGEVPADMQEPLADIQTSGKHLLRLINNVLDLAKIEAGRMELSLQDYSVHDTVGSVHSTLRPLAADKGLEFLATVPEDLPLAYGDGGRIAQCLMNLAGNSIKFTKAGKVEISVEEKGGLLTYRVSDTGIGIPPDKIDSLFTEFKQTDATIASEYGGTGLGLSISKKFVEMHGGRIWIESERGKGSAFIFEIPLRMLARD